MAVVVSVLCAFVFLGFVLIVVFGGEKTDRNTKT